MNDALSIGPFTIPFTTLMAAAALAAAYIYIRYGTDFQKEKYKKIREEGLNILAAGIIVFLFGTVVLRFPAFLSDPLAVLSYPGGAEEMLLAASVMTLYSIMQSKKHFLSGTALFGMIFTILIAGELVYHFFQPSAGISAGSLLPFAAHPVSFYIIAAGGAVLYWMHHRKVNLEQAVFPAVVIWAFSRWVIGFSDTMHTFFMVPVPGEYFWIPAAGAAFFYVYQRINKKQVTAWKS
ncbi:MAG: hypothetical protein EA344_12290 [Alkalicoccus sp.]|nr:MAG: hypothetical protein EA344_12290 [Alkalicoccus sp.]